jgi:hypothetical protein
VRERATTRPANDNDSPTDVYSVLDLIPAADDDKVADLVRRTEHLAIAVLVAMGVLLILAPVAYITLAYGI